MNRKKHYFLFRYAAGMWRIGEGYTVHSACKEAFGSVYGKSSGVKYKDMGTRSPKNLSEKVRKGFYSEKDWLDIPD